MVFNSEFLTHLDDVKKYYCLALAEDCAGFSRDKYMSVTLKHMFISILEPP